MLFATKLRHTGRFAGLSNGVLVISVLVAFSVDRASAVVNNGYNVIDLGPVVSSSDEHRDINSSGAVAYTRSDAVYLGQNGPGSIINNLFASDRLAINDASHLAGAHDLHSFIYRNGTKTDLGTLGPNGYAVAYDLNATDVVVGYAYTGSNYRAFMWQNGVMTELTVPNTTQDTASAALAINDLGQVAGGANGVAAVWTQGVPTFLSGLNTFSISGATGINASGQVIGNCDNSNYTNQQAVIWNGTTPTSLGSLSGYTYTNALGINDLGEVVGTAQVSNSDTAARAFLWMNNQMIDLNSLLPVGSPWLLESANAINNTGEIVGYGTVNGAPRSFLLTPLPEPTSLGMLAILGLALCRHRNKQICDD